MGRYYYSKNIKYFLVDKTDKILGILAKNHEHNLEEQQKMAWIDEINILKRELSKFKNFKKGHIIFEYSIPRMGRRADVIIIYSGVVFVIEFKVGLDKYPKHDVDQVLDYAIDLKNFHEKSHILKIVPILVSTKSHKVKNKYKLFKDGIFYPLRCNSNNIANNINDISKKYKRKINPYKWQDSQYKPTPTIIEAAQALYNGHSVKEISRSESGAINLSKTTAAINKIINKSKKKKIKSICFITGVPGAGKTLAGLNLANERRKFDKKEYAVFLSGNGPLVEVLQEALARDNEHFDNNTSKNDALRKIKSFIQNIHHFRDDFINVKKTPKEKVIIFDEAQRAWTREKTSEFMKKKKGIRNFNMSEPEFLIKIMDRHKDWAVIVCLIGGGQEINIGESGLPEWFYALSKFSHWKIFLSEKINTPEYTRGSDIKRLLEGLEYKFLSNLHLNTSIRSFRSENVSNFVKFLLDCDKKSAKKILSKLKRKYPFLMTRNLAKAKLWLREHSRGTERIGLTASSRAYRLKPFGIYVQLKIDPKNWFLNKKDDIRSSFYLEDVATEFDIQGLELDWSCVLWDADLIFNGDTWEYRRFKGTKWQKVNDEETRIYIKNAYRVLLTRARQGLIIFIPKGDKKDETRLPDFYDKTYKYFKEIGIEEI
ncbi:MAG: DUF2075 domain-containing protein [Candidatus Aenigmarchaeota archaeon]|nr:DUF2075 domain-containing protein [Candidatus Aenigmarchaeota archaeon]